MNKLKKCLSIITFVIVVMPVIAHTGYHHHEDDVVSNVACVGVLGGAVAAGCYGLYKFGSWLFSKTDQQILDGAYHEYDQTYNRYQSLLVILESWYIGGKAVRSMSENLLYEIGCEKVQEEYIGTYITQLERAISKLHSQHKRVTKRAQKLQQQALSDSSIYHIKRELDAIASRINHLLPRLGFLLEFLNYHKSYFVLFELESDLYSKYDRELRALGDTTLDYYGRAHEIRAAILTNFSHSTYPYMQYARHIKNDCNDLDNAINYLAFNYYERISAARQLYGYLIDIKEIVLTDPNYQHDVQSCEREKRERERIEAEERKARALERQARAQEREALAQEQKVREMREFNRIRAYEHGQRYNEAENSFSVEVYLNN